ncbi:MAG: gpW family head-tail joining protein [Guyparkeria sp.]
MDAQALASLELDVLQTRLSEAVDAQHQLMLGKQAVRLSFEGRDVTYTEAESRRLGEYITALRSAIQIKQGSSGVAGPIRLGV